MLRIKKITNKNVLVRTIIISQIYFKHCFNFGRFVFVTAQGCTYYTTLLLRIVSNYVVWTGSTIKREKVLINYLLYSWDRFKKDYTNYRYKIFFQQLLEYKCLNFQRYSNKISNIYLIYSFNVWIYYLFLWLQKHRRLKFY